MRWPFSRPKQVGPPPVICMGETPESRSRQEAEGDWEMVHARVAELRRHQRENHFQQRIRAAFEEHR